MRYALLIILCASLLALSQGSANAPEPRAVLSWDPDQVVEDLGGAADDTVYLYVHLVDIPEVATMSFETVWSPWSPRGGCYEMVTSRSTDGDGWNEGFDAEKLSDTTSVTRTLHFNDRPTAGSRVRLAFAIEGCQSSPPATFCLRNVLVTDESGNEFALETPNVATIMGGTDLRLPQYVTSVNQSQLTAGIPVELTARGGHFSNSTSAWLVHPESGRRIVAQVEPNGSSGIKCWLTPSVIDIGKWHLVTLNGDGFQSTFRQSIAIVPPGEYVPNISAEVNGRRFSRRDGVWYEVVGERLTRIRHDVVTVKFRAGTPENHVSALNSTVGTVELRRAPSGFRDVALTRAADPLTVVRAYLDDPDVLYAETIPTGRYESNDPYYSEEFWLTDTDGIDAEAAWAYETGRDEVIIAILDSGVDFFHEDLNGNIWVNPEEDIDGDGVVFDYADDMNGVDDDSNGEVDDLVGWDYTYTGEGAWCLRGWHGTLVAGVMSAVTNNSNGVAGICGGYSGACGAHQLNSGVRLMSVGTGESETDGSIVDEAIYYAMGEGAKVINMSFSLDIQDRTYIDQAIADANAAGCLLVAAAGSNPAQGETGPLYPASHDGVIAVGAVTPEGRKWDYSPVQPDVVAPVGGNDCAHFGSKVDGCPPQENEYYAMWTTDAHHLAVWPPTISGLAGCVPGAYTDDLGTKSDPPNYPVGRTSIAAAEVSALAGLIWSTNPALTKDEVRRVITWTAELPSPYGQKEHPWSMDYYVGAGVINAMNAIEAAARPLNYNFETGTGANWQLDGVERIGETSTTDYGIGDPPGNYYNPNTPKTPKHGCKSLWCDVTDIDAYPDPETSIEVAYISDPIKVNSHDPVTQGGRCYSITYAARLYTYSWFSGVQARFQVGAIFLGEGQVEIGRDTEICVQHLSEYGIHDFDGETKAFFEPPGTQYIRIYVNIRAHHYEIYPYEPAQATAIIDNLQLRSSDQVLSAGDPRRRAESGPLKVRCAPNPFTRGVDIYFEAPTAGPVELALFDVSGRLVRRYGPMRAKSGPQSFHWDGKDASARVLPSGVYAYRITAAGVAEAGKVVIVR